MSEIKKGDLVKVTITDAVRHIYSDGDFELEHGVILYNATHPDLHTVEKIEPPVVQFKPGDVIRRKSNQDLVYALTDGGFVPLHNAMGEAGTTDYADDGRDQFTSEHYERVDLS